MGIFTYQGTLKEKVIHAEISDQEIMDKVNSGYVVIVRGVFSKEELLECRSKVFSFGQETPESNPPLSADSISFHRIDYNHPLMTVKRIAHLFRFTYKNKGNTGVFKFFEPMNYFRNRLAGLSETFSFNEDVSGFLSQPAILHYPCGGGYLENHVDPVEPQKVEMVVAISQRGTDFKTGGLEFSLHGEWIDVEKYVEIGDIVMFKPDIPHRVTPIDPEETLSFGKNNGRWIIFSPIAHTYDKTKNEKELAAQK